MSRVNSHRAVCGSHKSETMTKNAQLHKTAFLVWGTINEFSRSEFRFCFRGPDICLSDLFVSLGSIYSFLPSNAYSQSHASTPLGVPTLFGQKICEGVMG